MQKTEPFQSILTVIMYCPVCGWFGKLRDAEPDIDGDGSLGCPDCLHVGRNSVVLREIN